MKPYFLVVKNRITLSLKKIKCKSLDFGKIEMFDNNTKFVFSKDAKVNFGERIITDGRFVAVVVNSGELNIGSNVYFNEGGMVSCKCKVSNGDGCKFGPNVKIFDNNHNFNAEEGVLLTHNTGEVRIGKNCWIASNAVILKGADIGDNCVIGANCVIKGKIPPKSIVTQDSKLSIKPIV